MTREQKVPVGLYADYTSSRRTPFLCALALGFTAVVLYATGTSIAMLAVGRCIQGISVSILFSVGLAYLVDTVGRDEVGQWIGFVLSGMNTGVMFSPFLGGLVYDRAGYLPVFFMCLGIIAIVFLLRISIVERKTAAKYQKTLSTADEAGQATSGEHDVESHASPFSVVSSVDGETRPKKNISSDSIGAEASERDPLISTTHNTDRNPWNEPQSAKSLFFRRLLVTKTLFKSTRILTACCGIFIHITVITAYDAVLPIYVNQTFGWRSTGAGLIFLAITIPAILGAAVGDASDRFGPRKVALCGFAIATPSIALLGLVRHDSVQQIILLCAILASTGKLRVSNVSQCNWTKFGTYIEELLGLGLNVLLAPLASDLSFAVEDLNEENPGLFQSAGAYAQVYSMFNGGLAAGMMAGPPFASFIFTKTNWAIMNFILAAICLLGTVPVVCANVFFLRRPPFGSN